MLQQLNDLKSGLNRESPWLWTALWV
jgi:hypothetical protein